MCMYTYGTRSRFWHGLQIFYSLTWFFQPDFFFEPVGKRINFSLFGKLATSERARESELASSLLPLSATYMADLTLGDLNWDYLL